MSDDFFMEEDEAAEARDDAMQAHETRLLNAAALLMGNPDGVYFLRWLIGESGALAVRYPADYRDAAFREGKRVIGAAVFAKVVACGGAGKFFEEDAKS